LMFIHTAAEGHEFPGHQTKVGVNHHDIPIFELLESSQDFKIEK